MAEAFLEDIYRYAEVITAFRRMVECLRVEDAHLARLLMNEYGETVNEICIICGESGYVEADTLKALVRNVYQTGNDMIVRADLMENGILPILERWVQSLGCILQQVDDEYQLESTACGFLTMKNLRTDTYLHSNNNPMEEARKQIEFFYEPSVDSYAVLGCGLGYQAYQLYKVSNGSVKIRLYEQDYQVVEYAKRYGVLDWIPQEILEVFTEDPVYSFLQDADSNGVGAFMHLPSIRQLRDKVEQNAMLQAYGEQHTTKVFKKDFLINFYRNIHSGAHFIDDLDANRFKREVVVVAAGPSLDDFMGVLSAWQGQKTIIAVGTVFGKLIRAGVKPDYVVVADAQKRTFRQIEGVEKEEVPMILDAVAYWGFARNYQGPKYLILTPQSSEILEYGKQNRINVWPTGGTVTSLALEVAIQYHAQKVYLAGVDLSYPDGVTHASGTMDRSVESLDGMEEACGVGGKIVYTTHVFQIYQQWIENHISQCPKIKWYNLSTKGVRIKGTIEIGEQILRDYEK